MAAFQPPNWWNEDDWPETIREAELRLIPKVSGEGSWPALVYLYEAQRRFLMERLSVCPADEVLRNQGMVAMLDWLLRLPERNLAHQEIQAEMQAEMGGE